jgi:plastocyanin
MHPFTLNRLRKTVVLIVAAVSIHCAGCVQHSAPPFESASEAPPTGTLAAQQVTIDNFTFSPATVTIAAGTTVTWINHDDVPHTVTSNDKLFSSQAMDTDGTFSHMFTAPGIYPYFCAVHRHMTGQIIVK